MDMLKEVAAALPGIQVPEALNAVNDLGISFPEIAVVGQESTGKSSVLERITILPLFPRGVDIVTRSAGSLLPHACRFPVQTHREAHMMTMRIVTS